MNRYDTVFIDLDHTLLDSDESERRSFARCMASVGIDDADRLLPRYQQINRALWNQVEHGTLSAAACRVRRFELFHNELVAQGHITQPADPHELADLFADGFAEFGNLLPGATTLLDGLVERDLTTVLITNGVSEIQRARISRLHLDPYFNAIMVSDELGTAKPNRSIFNLAFDAIGGGTREHTLMVGDSLSSDIKGGENAGLATCWFNPHRAALPTDAPRVDYEVFSLVEVLPILDAS